jgi:hypothetical protein
MPEPDEIRKRLAELPCPICRKTDYQLLPRNDGGTTETLYTAHCSGCRYSFPVAVPVKAMAFTDPDVAQQMKEMACPACQERGAELDFRCHTSVRGAYYFMTCRSCKKPFLEKAPMEAYE